MKIIYLLLLIFSSFLTYSQNFPVGKRTITIIDQQRNNRAISTDIYYPASATGNNTPLANGNEKFPVVVFGHGFLIGAGSYEWLADSLASNGYIAAFPNTEGSISPDHLAFGKDISVVCSQIILFDGDIISPFYGRVMNKGAVGGHSMGGGASFLAASLGNDDIKMLFNFAAAETTPSAIAAALSVNVPSLVLSGSRDCIVPAQTQRQMFDNIPSENCKAYFNITNALHCQFADNDFTCATGQVFSGCNSTPLNKTEVFQKTASLLLPFLNFHLKRVCAQGEVFENNFNSLSATTKLLQCPNLRVCSPLPLQLLYFKGSYDGKVNVLKWKTTNENYFKSFDLQKSSNGQDFETISSLTGNSAPVKSVEFVFTDAFPFAGSNFYRLKMVNADNSFTYTEIINLISEGRKLIISGIYPNPVKGIFQVKINSASQVQSNIEIVDFSGRRIFSKTYTINEGSGKIEIDASTFKNGVYMFLLKSPTGEILEKYKLVKM
ncbi:MAG: T9SS type A sorting domain-containing protein [Ginsengibacter sp.]